MFKKIIFESAAVILLLISLLLLQLFGCYYVTFETIPPDDDGEGVVSMRLYP